MRVHYCYMESPVGDLLLAGEGASVNLIAFPKESRNLLIRSDWRNDREALREPIRQLEDYFSGRRKAFDLELAPEGTEFQLDVWQALQKIPYGETVSYGELARIVGKPKAARAVGGAVGRNPLPIVIPCHRVIGSDGSLVGFGGGMEIKKTLLSLERENR